MTVFNPWLTGAHCNTKHDHRNKDLFLTPLLQSWLALLWQAPAVRIDAVRHRGVFNLEASVELSLGGHTISRCFKIQGLYLVLPLSGKASCALRARVPRARNVCFKLVVTDKLDARTTVTRTTMTIVFSVKPQGCNRMPHLMPADLDCGACLARVSSSNLRIVLGRCLAYALLLQPQETARLT